MRAGIACSKLTAFAESARPTDKSAHATNLTVATAVAATSPAAVSQDIRLSRYVCTSKPCVAHEPVCCGEVTCRSLLRAHFLNIAAPDFAWNTGGGSNALPWTRTNDVTPSSDTGPSTSNVGGYYWYTEASGRQPGDRFVLRHVAVSGNVRLGCTIGFEYHMLGAGMGTLELEASVDAQSAPVAVWSKCAAAPARKTR